MSFKISISTSNAFSNGNNANAISLQGLPLNITNIQTGELLVWDGFNWVTSNTFPPGSNSSTGPTGPSGKSILNGLVMPSDMFDGVNGDFYINTLTYQIYGPKTSGSWGSPTLLIGYTGPTGESGNSLLNGSIPPTVEGNKGDFYINTSTNEIYGPKTTIWNTGTSIIGPTGPTGSKGTSFGFFSNPTGVTGTTGSKYEEISWISGPSPSYGNDVILSLNKIKIQVPGEYKIELNVSYNTDTGTVAVLETFLSQSTGPSPSKLANSSVYTLHGSNTESGNGSGSISWVGFLNQGFLTVWVIQLSPLTVPTPLLYPSCYLDKNGTRCFISKLN